jgi:hypothetical protein
MESDRLQWTNFVVLGSDKDWAAVRNHWQGIADQIDSELAAISVCNDYDNYLSWAYQD